MLFSAMLQCKSFTRLTFSTALIVLLLINSDRELKSKREKKTCVYERRLMCVSVGVWKCLSNFCRRFCPAQKIIVLKTHRAANGFLCGWLIDESIRAEFGCNTGRVGVSARRCLLNSSRIECRLLSEEVWRSWNRSRLAMNTIERRSIWLDIYEWILTVSVLLCGILCIVFNVECATRTPITTRSREVILFGVVCFREWLCFCVHPPVWRLRIWIVTSGVVGLTGISGITVVIEGLLHELSIVGNEGASPLVLVLAQVTNVGCDEP